MSSEQKKIGFGLIGVGAIGRVHAEHLMDRVPNAELVGIADINYQAAKELGAKLKVSKVVQDYKQLLSDEEIVAVVIAVPPFLKKDMILETAKAGKNIFVEKPMCLSLNEADEIIDAVSSAKIKFQVGYQRRFDHAFVKARKMIESGEIGKIMMVKSWTRDPPGNPQGWSTDPKLSGGIWLDTCSHDFDVIRFLTGAKVTQVYAEGVNLAYKQLEAHKDYDNVLVTLDLDNGALGHCDSCGYNVYGYAVGAEVIGTEGVVSIRMGENSSLKLLKKTSDTEDLPLTFQERFAQAYHDELEDFTNCILQDRTVQVTAEDGRAAIEIGLAAAESAVKRMPVKLPLGQTKNS